MSEQEPQDTTEALRREVEILKYWKADALERIADDEQAYQEQSAMLRKMNDVIAKVADHLHAAKLEMISVIDIKDEYAEVVKRSKKPKVHNAKVSGAGTASAGLPGYASGGEP